jgi:prephenate dehydratase
MSTQLKVATLGSAGTFAGEATTIMCEKNPLFGEVVYRPSMEACYEALDAGEVDVAILGQERTGQPHPGKEVLTQGYTIVMQETVPLACNLYVKPGTPESAILRIVGHGSIHQCTAYLDTHFPGVPREQHHLNSVEAAKEVMAGDGSIAVVGSRSLLKLVSGLDTMATGIDSGAAASWWAYAKKPILSDKPNRLVVTARCGPGGELGELISGILAAGFRLRTMGSFAVNHGAYNYDYIMTFAGQGTRTAVETVIQRFKSARLAGAFNQAD